MKLMSSSRHLVVAFVLMVLVLCSASRIQSQGAAYKMQVVSQVNGLRVQTDISGGAVASFGGNGAFQIDAPGVAGGRFAVTEAGRVGIATPSPTSQLHLFVPGSGNPISAMTVDVDSFGTPGNALASHFFRVRDMGANGPSAFLIRGDGNVGIGTDVPAQKLTVAGTVYSTSGGFTFPDATVQATGGATTYTTTCGGNAALTGASTSICHLNLPSGTYLLELSGIFFNGANDPGLNNNRRVQCGITGVLLWDRDIAGTARATMALHGVQTVTSGGSDVNCSTPQAGIVVHERRFTATQLKGNVVLQ